MRPPRLNDFVPLDAEHVYTEYLKRKAARLAGERIDGIERVTFDELRSSTFTQIFAVRGDSGAYRVWLRPGADPWMAACSRGGVHDAQPEGRACSHMLAAAAKWLAMNADLLALIETREAAANG